MSIAPTAQARFELDIDLRLTWLWGEAIEVFGENELPYLGWFMRAAYGQGHYDALREPDPEALYREHGYRVPVRRGA